MMAFRFSERPCHKHILENERKTPPSVPNRDITGKHTYPSAHTPAPHILTYQKEKSKRLLKPDSYKENKSWVYGYLSVISAPGRRAIGEFEADKGYRARLYLN